MPLVELEPAELFVRRYDDLRKSLAARDDYERLNGAAILRQLLMDGLVHEANRTPHLRLRFLVNDVGTIKDVPITPDLLFHGQGLDPTRIRTRSGVKELSLDQFIAVPIWEAPSGVVTVRDLIKLAANKAGGVHFDASRTPEELRQEELVQRVAALGIHSLAIALETVTRIALAALRPLRDAIVTLPTSLRLFAHYRLEVGALEFDGRQQFMETHIDHDLGAGWGWHGVARVMPQAEIGERVIYELGNADGSPPRFTLSVTDEGGLLAVADLDRTTRLRVAAEAFRGSLLFDRFSYLALEVRYAAEQAELELFLNNISAGEMRAPAGSWPKRVTRHTLGADLSGHRPATFQVRELVIADAAVEAELRRAIANYFWMQWHE